MNNYFVAKSKLFPTASSPVTDLQTVYNVLYVGSLFLVCCYFQYSGVFKRKLVRSLVELSIYQLRKMSRNKNKFYSSLDVCSTASGKQAATKVRLAYLSFLITVHAFELGPVYMERG